MRTGEGKTLAATAPAYLNALTGKEFILLRLMIIWQLEMPFGWGKYITLLAFRLDASLMNRRIFMIQRQILIKNAIGWRFQVIREFYANIA